MAETVKGMSAPGILVPPMEGGRDQIRPDGAARLRTCHQGVDGPRVPLADLHCSSGCEAD